MSTPRQRLYDRLPELYHIHDGQQEPPGQLEAYLDVIDQVMAAVRDNIEHLYDDLFIDSCDDWVVPYIADLLGSSHLSGAPWTLRADTARTLHHRRRKGTLGAMESLSHALTGWAAHTVELKRNLAWNQHLNHQRPDLGGAAPLASVAFNDPVRHGTVNLRDPAGLSFFNGPFDPFAHLLDIRPQATGAARYNFPVLGIFLWRLQDYLVPRLRPGLLEAATIDVAGSPLANPAAHALRVSLHPLAQPMVLFNTHRFHADDEPAQLSLPDAVPGPMPVARLNHQSGAGNPAEYVRVVRDEADAAVVPGADSVGLTLHLPSDFPDWNWQLRGADLRCWEQDLSPALSQGEIAIDPRVGRALIGVDSDARVGALQETLSVSVTHGFSGPTGAQPVARPPLPETWQGMPPQRVRVPETSLEDALADLADYNRPLIIEITDSRLHELDLTQVAGHHSGDGAAALGLAHSLWIRAADGQRPVIALTQPLRFRPAELHDALALDRLERMTVRLEGLYLSCPPTAAGDDPIFAPDAALIERAALHRLEIVGCTLDPGGQRQIAHPATDERAPLRTAIRQDNDYGFLPPDENDELTAFNQVPEIAIERSITGALALADRHSLELRDSIIDAGAGVAAREAGIAIGAPAAAETVWGPPTHVVGVTIFGRSRVERISGEGGIFVHRLQAHDDQAGCLKFSWLHGQGDRLPPHHGCVFGHEATLSFVSQVFGEAGYAQLRLRCDSRILEQGPKRDAMGAFGYLMNSHKWKNLNIRFREYMPVGVRPALVPVT